MKKKILLTGSNGNLAKEIIKSSISDFEIIGFDIQEENYNNTNRYYQVDLSNEFRIKEFYTTLKELELIPDVIINNAALDSVPSTDVSNPYWNISKFSDFFEVNVKGPALLFTLISSYWVENKIKGQVINISSIYAEVSPDPNLYPKGFIKDVNYGASKAAFTNIFKQFAVIFSKNNITINFIELGGVEAKNHDKVFRSKYLKRVPDTSFVKIENLSKLILILLELEKGGINGATIRMDSGYNLI